MNQQATRDTEIIAAAEDMAEAYFRVAVLVYRDVRLGRGMNQRTAQRYLDWVATKSPPRRRDDESVSEFIHRVRGYVIYSIACRRRALGLPLWPADDEPLSEIIPPKAGEAT